MTTTPQPEDQEAFHQAYKHMWDTGSFKTKAGIVLLAVFG